MLSEVLADSLSCAKACQSELPLLMFRIQGTHGISPLRERASWAWAGQGDPKGRGKGPLRFPHVFINHKGLYQPRC